MKAGKQLKKQVERKQDELSPEQVTFAPERAEDVSQIDPRAPGVTDEQFPTADLAAPKSKADKLWATKLQIQDQTGQTGVTPFGVLEAKDEDFKRLQDRQALMEEANFQAWFAKFFDYASPAQKKRAKELYPQYYAQRKALLKRQSENLYRYARLKLMGVEDEDDLRTAYAAETGRLDIGPLTHLLHPEQNERAQGMQERKFARGMWNPWRVFGDEAVGSQGQAQTSVRAEQMQNYAQRAWPGWNSALGMTTGMPPTNSVDQNQGTNTWWRVMRNAVADIPPAPAATPTTSAQ
jgi:hypothetical protein